MAHRDHVLIFKTIQGACRVEIELHICVVVPQLLPLRLSVIKMVPPVVQGTCDLISTHAIVMEGPRQSIQQSLFRPQSECASACREMLVGVCKIDFEPFRVCDVEDCT